MNRNRLIFFVWLIFLAVIVVLELVTPSRKESGTKPEAIATPTVRPLAPRSVSMRMGIPVDPPVSSPAIISPAPAASAIVSDDQKEINATLSDLIEQVQAGYFSTILDKFAVPDSFASTDVEVNLKEWFLQRLRNPEETQIWIQILKAMKSQNPTLNATGDEATIPINDPTGQGLNLRPLVLKKVDGKWYFTVTEILAASTGFGLNQNPPSKMWQK